jgi:glycerol-3-phosphate O-acyltransferase / dihydroxyacetone phosphate acyltransferase
MFRRILCAVLRLALRIYFRRVEIVGLENVPANKPVIFVLNHPNALVDPVFLLCLAPRRVSFLAKAPLFRMPVIGSLVRALDSLPAYRQQDAGEDVTRNRETFEAARQLLSRGGTIGICPEGVSHNEPRLKPLKTGAARIALGAASTGTRLDVKIVPVGLYYTEKTTFRSSALLHFGEPITVEPVELQTDGAPPREAVHALRKQIEESLRDVMLHAEHDEALGLVERVEQIFSADELSEHDEEQSLARSLQVRQRLLEGYGILRTHSPKRIAAIDVRVNRLHSELTQAGIDPFDLSLPASPAQSITWLIAQFAISLLLAPFAIVGTLLNYPAYRLAGYLARTLSRGEQDVVSTFKIVAALLLFPLTWVVTAVVTWAFVDLFPALGALVIVPVCGYVAIRLAEELDRLSGGFQALMLFLLRRRWFLRLLAERAAIRKEILALRDETIPTKA